MKELTDREQNIVLETIELFPSITKKEFKEQARYTTYCARGSKRPIAHGIYFDWAYEMGVGCGFKYCFLAWDCTKKEAFDTFWDVFVWCHGSAIVHESYKAETMSQRKKCPIMLSPVGYNFNK